MKPSKKWQKYLSGGQFFANNFICLNKGENVKKSTTKNNNEHNVQSLGSSKKKTA